MLTGHTCLKKGVVECSHWAGSIYTAMAIASPSRRTS